MTEESDYFEKAKDLKYFDDQVFFTGVDNLGGEGLYMKTFTHDEEKSNFVVEVAGDLNSPNSVGNFD